MNDEQKVAWITGANTGIGKEVARQLATSGRYRKITLACRSLERARGAKADLEASTGKAIFEIVTMDVADLASVRAVLASSIEPIDHLVLNAGGSGGKTPIAPTKDGVTQILAANVLGHAALLEGLLAAGRLRETAIYVGSEAARGVPKMGMKRPSLPTSSVEDFVAICDGSFFRSRKVDGALAYGQVKYVGALWMAALARRHPKLRLLTVSPGNTRGTEGSRDLPPPLRVFLRYVFLPFLGPMLGLAHDLDVGARRLVDALGDDALASGGFYASGADTLTGPLVDQRTVFADLGDARIQDNAFTALHRFL